MRSPPEAALQSPPLRFPCPERAQYTGVTSTFQVSVLEVQMAKFRPERKQGCATQFGATSSPGQPAEDLNTPLIILDSDSEVTSDNYQKVAEKLKMQFSPASEDIDPLLLVDDETISRCILK